MFTFSRLIRAFTYFHSPLACTYLDRPAPHCMPASRTPINYNSQCTVGNISALETYAERSCKPLFLLYRNGAAVTDPIEGTNAPVIEAAVKEHIPPLDEA